jgi:hypothetical protein
MADCMATEISIGGTIPRDLGEKLCKIIRETEAALEYGDAVFSPDTLEDLKTAIVNDSLVLCDAERAWGQFEELEAFLQKHEIPYDRHTEGRYEYDSEYVRYRPGIGVCTMPTLRSGNPVVEVASLQPVVKSIERLHKYAEGKIEKASLLRRMERLQNLLRSKLPREMPPLEGFVITVD